MSKPYFKVTTVISLKQVEDLMILACEGGSNYWAYDMAALKGKGSYVDCITHGFKITDQQEDGTKKRYTVSPAKVKKALSLMSSRYPKHFADMFTEDTDTNTGDVFLQLCVFGEVIYG
jgi:hypothetical protein